MTDNHLKKIEDLLSPDSAGATGFITRDDLVMSFNHTFMAIGEINAASSPVIVALSHKDDKGGPLYKVLGDLSHFFYRVEAAGLNQDGSVGSTVTGSADPTTVEQLAAVLDSLIRSLSSSGFVHDGRVFPPNNPVGIAAPTSGGNLYTFIPRYSDRVMVLPDLVWLNANLDAVQYTPSTTAAWGPQGNIGILGGNRVHWNGTDFEDWNPPIDHYVASSGGLVSVVPFEARVPQTFTDVDELPDPAPPTDAALISAWTTDQHLVLGDNTFVYWTGTAWAAGKAP